MRRSISLLLLATLLCAFCIPCAAADTDSAALPKAREYVPFSDVAEDAWYAEAVRVCYEAGVLNGVTDTTFAPGEPLTLAQLEMLTARFHWRLQGNEGDPPAAPAGTGRVAIELAGGAAYDMENAFFMAHPNGLGGKPLPAGDLLVTLTGEDLPTPYPSYIHMTVDGQKTFRCALDLPNSFDPLFVMYRLHVSGQDFRDWAPGAKVATYFGSDRSSEDAWYWGADHYLKNLPGASMDRFSFDLTKTAARLDAATLLSLATPDELVPPLRADAPPDEQNEAAVRLYQAGVLTGVDSQGTFDGKGELSRAQFTVLLARLLRPELRVGPASAEGQAAQG